MNRRIAAVRGLFEFAVMTGARADNPVPAARRSSGLRAARRGLLGHIGPGRPRGGGRLVRQPRRLPESLEPDDVAAFLADLRTFRDRAITLAMLLGGLRAAEVRSLRLADVDMGLRRVRVTGKGGKERVVPVDGAFFAELAAYLREERPRVPHAGVLRGAARPDRRAAAHRGRAAADLPHPPGVLRGRCGCGRTGCAIPTAPSSRAAGIDCWRCGS